MVKKVGKYQIGKTLGEGTFGKVKFAVNTETQEQVAIKVLDKEKIQKQNMGKQIKKEISIMKMVKHDYVVSLKEVLASRTKIFIVLELITGGELFDKIVSEGRFDQATARYYFTQLIEGVMYCHKQGVCHRDLKPENLLLDEKGDLKISDFGLSALYNGPQEERQGQLLHTTCGTPNYVAPEVLNDMGYDGRSADVWSCGVILYVLLAGFLPFDEPTMSALFRKIQKAEFSYPSWFDADVKDLLDRILVTDPEKRFSIDDIYQHKWMRNGDTKKYGGERGELITVSSGAESDAKGSTELVASKDDVENAIQETTGGDDIDEEEEGPRSSNAFDLINMLGGTALNRMLMSQEEVSTDVAKVMHFTSTLGAEEICNKMKEKLVSLQKEDHPGNSHKVNLKNMTVKSCIKTSKGIVGINIAVLKLGKKINLIEVSRGRGDVLAHKAIMEELTDKMHDLLPKPKQGTASS